MFKIITDSSSNLNNDYLNNEKNVKFASVPLTIRIEDKVFVDDENIDIDDLLNSLNKSKVKASSSCPSPSEFLSTFDDECFNFVITVSSKLSGSYNSAMVAKDMYKNKDNVFVIDSLSAAGGLEVLVIKLLELIKDNKSFDEIKNEIIKYRDSSNVLFVLDKYDNFIKSGRVSKVIAFIATKLVIKPICFGEDGVIKIRAKIRTYKGALKTMVNHIGIMCKNVSNRVCVITYTKCLESALFVKDLISKTYAFKDIKLRENRGLCSFYSLENGIIVAF